MNNLKKIFYSKTALLLLVVVMIYLFEQNAIWVENFYSKGLYRYISLLQSILLNWLPFSFGDVLYVVIGIYILYRVIKFSKTVYISTNKRKYLLYAVKHIVNFLCVALIIFKLLWGINYSRLGVAYQFKLTKHNYSNDELIDFTKALIFDANECRQKITDTSLPEMPLDLIFSETEKCYVRISEFYPFLTANYFAIKPSLYSFAGNYLGYTGYYNPFTGEAQIRSDLPSILLPFICCHEVAHQLGYASEEEANFIGCIAANESTDIRFKYSIDLELLDYTQKELMLRYVASNRTKEYLMLANSFRDCMSTQVKNDRNAIRDFFNKNRKDVANISNFVYDKYLKLNKQQQGIESYNEVVAWVLSYRNQFSK